MIEAGELYAWLEERNCDYRRRDIPPMRRVFEALDDLQREKGISVTLTDPISRSISAWFEAHTPPGSMTIGPTVEGAYRFDGTVWVLQMSFVIGSARINPK